MNALVNHVLGVKREEDVRFLLMGTKERKEDSTMSQTDSITAYTIHPPTRNEGGIRSSFSITVVDTPGFLDTRGLDEDKTLIKNIHQFFTRYVDRLHRIGIVIPATTTRLTPSQRFLYDQILSLFGNDVKDRFVLLSTFADQEEPQTLAAVKQAGISCRGSYQFNAGCLYKKNRNQLTMQELLWEMTADNFRRLLEDLQTAEPIGLELTREVLEKRETLEKALVKVQEEIKLGKY